MRSACLITALLLVSLAARAQQAPEETRWYGWQTLLTDGAAVALVALTAVPGASNTQVTALGVTSALVYGFGGPFVHAARGRWNAALKSLGLRVGLGLAGGVIGGLIGAAGCSNPSRDVGCLPDAGTGGMVGVLMKPGFCQVAPGLVFERPNGSGDGSVPSASQVFTHQARKLQLETRVVLL